MPVYTMSLRRLISTDNTSGLMEGIKEEFEQKQYKRLYFYYINERGNLYHVYDIEPFIIALCRRFVDSLPYPVDLLASVKSYKNLMNEAIPNDKKSSQNGKMESLPSGPSFLKDGKFLDFFFKRLRRNYAVNSALLLGTIDTVPYSLIPQKNIEPCKNGCSYSSYLEHSPEWGLFLEATISSVNGAIRASHSERSAAGSCREKSDVKCDDLRLLTIEMLFPFVSLCGKELNFIACEKEPIVFHSLTLQRFPGGNTDNHSISDWESGEGQCIVSSSEAFLTFAGNLTVPFFPKALKVDCDGFMYHPLSVYSQISLSETPYGLVGASVGLQLGFNFVCDDLNQEGNYEIMWEGSKTVIERF